MSLRLINKLYTGCLFIHNEENYLVHEIREINDESQTMSIWLVNCEEDFDIWNGSYSEFTSKVVK